MSKEVMRQALDVLKYVDTQDNDRDFLLVSELELLDNAITALRKALTEQPAQQEPVAWMTKDGEIYKHECWPEYEARPLVFGDTSPPAQRTWVGLTETEINNITCGMVKGWVMERLVDAVEAKLKEKNT